MEYYLIIMILIASGFGTGLIIGTASGTCGMILLPVITLFVGRPIHESIGSSLITDTIVGAIAGLVFLRKGKVQLKSLGFLAITGIIGALIGSNFTSATPEKALLLFTGISLVVMGINFMVYGIRKNIDYVNSKINFRKIRENKTIVFLIVGFIIGFVNGFMGIGGGGFISIMLIFVLGYEVHTAIGTSLIFLSIIAGAGSFGHILYNEFYSDAVLFLGLSAGLGAFLGSFYANRLNEDKLGRVIGLMIVIMGSAVLARMLFS